LVGVVNRSNTLHKAVKFRERELNIKEHVRNIREKKGEVRRTSGKGEPDVEGQQLSSTAI
jgi:hypothetical protein